MTAARPLTAVPTDDELPAVEALNPAHSVVAAAMRSTAKQVLALGLSPADLPGYAAIWQAILDACMAGDHPDPVTVGDQLTRSGNADQYTHNLLTRATTATAWAEQLETYARAALTARYSDEIDGFGVSLTASSGRAETERERIIADHLDRLRSIRARRTQLNDAIGDPL